MSGGTAGKLSSVNSKHRRPLTTGKMGIPFETLLPYGLMLGLFGVTVSGRPVLTATLLTSSGRWIVRLDLLREQLQAATPWA